MFTKILYKLKDNEQALHLMQFFKTAKGQYGYGDKFLVIKVPILHKLVKTYYGVLSETEIEELLHNQYHEVRLFALFMMIEIFEKQSDKRLQIFNLYCNNTKYINNWDLVDLSAPKIVGRYCFENQNIEQIERFANSKSLWCERISVVSQLYYIRRGQFSLALNLCAKFITPKHDLMNKACGWILREIGKKDIYVL